MFVLRWFDNRLSRGLADYLGIARPSPTRPPKLCKRRRKGRGLVDFLGGKEYSNRVIATKNENKRFTNF